MYWTDLGRDEIRRANLDGSGVEVLATALSHGLQNPIGIAVDTVAQRLYWTDSSTDAAARSHSAGMRLQALRSLPSGASMQQTSTAREAT